MLSCANLYLSPLACCSESFNIVALTCHNFLSGRNGQALIYEWTSYNWRGAKWLPKSVRGYFYTLSPASQDSGSDGSQTEQLTSDILCSFASSRSSYGQITYTRHCFAPLPAFYEIIWWCYVSCWIRLPNFPLTGRHCQTAAVDCFLTFLGETIVNPNLEIFLRDELIV